MFHPYKLNVYVNGTWFHNVLIDSHVTEKHGDSITEHIVLDLVKLLHMEFYTSEHIDENGFEYFVNNELRLGEKVFRLVWLIPPDKSYIGVRTAFRRKSRGK